MRSALCAARMAIVAAVLLAVRPAMAETMTGERALQALFAGQAVDMNAFAGEFLTKISASQITQLISGMKKDYGRLIGVQPAGNGFVLRFEHVEVPALITLDANGRIIGLRFATPQADIGTLVAAIKALPGRTSVLVAIDGKPIATHEADRPLAVGSAAKLAVLVALKRAIAQKRLAWDTVVKLDPGWKSLPSGELRNWPDGTPLTIATLAHLMISISDNTATDALIHLVGHQAVEAVSPRNTPFLTTRQLFTLKTLENASLRAEWQERDSAARRMIVEHVADAPLPSPSEINPAATLQVEWFLTAQELCGLLDATADLPSTSINSGPVDQNGWQSVAYKGGSEVGVLNFSSRLVDKDGHVSCVVATWNSDSPLDENRLMMPYKGLVQRLAMHQ